MHNNLYFSTFRVLSEEARPNLRASPRILLLLAATGLLLMQTPLAAAEPCITKIESTSNATQLIFDSATDSFRLGIRIADPGAGKTLIFVIRPNSCTSQGIGPSLLGNESSDKGLPSPSDLRVPMLP